MADIVQTSDRKITFTLTSGGSAVNLSSLIAYAAWIYYQDGDVLAKFSRINATGLPKTGFKALTVVESSAGQFRVDLETSVTQLAKRGDLRAEIKTQSTDAEFENNTFTDVVTDIDLSSEIKKSIDPETTDLT